MKLKLPDALGKLGSKVGVGKVEAADDNYGDLGRFQDIPQSDEESGGEMSMTKATSNHIGGDIAILVECCSAWNISSKVDAYVTVKLGDQKVHKTKALWNTQNPIWTIKHDNVFILYTNEDELSRAGGLLFSLKDFNIASSSTSLGSVFVSKTQIEGILEKRQSERVVFAVDTSQRKLRNSAMDRVSFFFNGKQTNNNDCGLALRFRLASEEDEKFMENFKVMQRKKSIVSRASALDKMMSEKAVTKFSTFTKKMHKTDKLTGEKLYRVKPGPDPLDEEGTKWMSTRQLEERALEPSRNWIDAGSGSDRIFIEIIGCDDLPNLDQGLLSNKNKTDPFVSIVHEDTAVISDTISDTLKPRWMPWHQRAFVFRVFDPKSVVFIGVFDRDDVGSHDFIGRVAIRPSKFVANTEYLLHYNLYESSSPSDPSMPVDERKKKGKIILRLRLERDSSFNAVVSTATVTQTQYVNTSTFKNLSLLKQTCRGTEVPPSRFESQAFFGYVAELTCCWENVLVYSTEGLLNMFLWRGSVQVPLPTFPAMKSRNSDCVDETTPLQSISSGSPEKRYITVWAPINSMIAFFWGVFLVENPVLLPSFLVFCIPWILFGILCQQSRHPSPWHRPRSIREILCWVVGVKSQTVTIAPNEGSEEEMEYQKRMKEKIFKVREEREKALREAEKERLRQEAEIASVGDDNVDIESKTKMFSINPLNGLLFPYQQLLEQLCSSARYIQNLMQWELPGVVLLISLVCLILSVLLAITAPILAWLAHWVLRLLVWIFLSPLMAVADQCYFSKEAEDTESKSAQSKMESGSSAQLEAQIQLSRARREDAMKLKDMRCYRFGRFINVTPMYGVYRFPDIPLPESCAVPYKLKSVNFVPEVKRQKGTMLKGTMIHLEEKEIPPCEVYGAVSDVSDVSKRLQNIPLSNFDDFEDECLSLVFMGWKLKNVEGAFRKSDPFFEVHAASSEDGDFDQLVYRSEFVANNLSPKWEPAQIDLTELCGGDGDKQFRISVYDFENDSNHDFMGSVDTTVNELMLLEKSGANAANLSSIDVSKALTLTKGRAQKACGKLIVSSVKVPRNLMQAAAATKEVSSEGEKNLSVDDAATAHSASVQSEALNIPPQAVKLADEKQLKESKSGKDVSTLSAKLASFKEEAKSVLHVSSPLRHSASIQATSSQV
eukprot:CAMPEP_0196802060 /NCGR_PEP_ID=MMETSP1362-20130617/1775_1 /TAXON_ID=163516 /ORGANISM="Leptocylindrus danicus, Strain CCMP1856" /LENGTH=1172 /DNA_ID=CAMNT_0042173267 /DNA_START=95 /DNA_END=3609 /DNA_ORIENTATION=-